MSHAHAADRRDDGAVYESGDATVRVRPRRIGADHRVLEYAVATTGERPVQLRLRQPIPDSISFADVGFPGDCGEDWERDADGLVFERELEPAATVRTAWGVDGEFGSDLEAPTVETEAIAVPLEAAGTGAERDGAPTDSDGETGEAGPVAAGGATGSDAQSEAVESTPLDDDGEPTADAAEDRTGASLDLDFPATDAANATDEAGAGEQTSSDRAPSDRPTADRTGDGQPPDRDATAGEREGGSRSLDPRPGADSDADDGSERGDEFAESAGVASTSADETPASVESGSESSAAATDSTAGGSESDATSSTDSQRSLVHQLVAELHDDSLDDRHRVALADALEVRLSDSTNAFVEHLREKQRRRTDRLADDVAALEESIEGLYAATADASEVDTLKRAITKLDDRKAADGELRELRSRFGTLAETSADREDVAALRDEHEELAGSVEEADRQLAALGDAHESLAAAAVSREKHHELASDLETLEGELAALEDLAAAEAALSSLEERVAGLEAEAATQADVDGIGSELEDVVRRVDDRIEDLADRHEALASEATSASELASLRETQRERHNATTSEVAALRERLQTEHSTDDELEAELDRRLQRNVATLACFGIGCVGLAATIPLAMAGSSAAAVTFLGGAGAIGLWRRSLDGDGGLLPGPLPTDRLASLRERFE